MLQSQVTIIQTAALSVTVFFWFHETSEFSAELEQQATLRFPEPVGRGEADYESSPSSRDNIALFDGKTLTGWAPSDFAGRGEVKVEKGRIILEMGYMTGITCTNPVPRMDYEVSLEAMRVAGSDFFCGLTFPVGDSSCSFVVGGWGGGVVGLSSIDGEDAANNDTTTYRSFQTNRWYAIRVRVTSEKIEAWINKERVVDQGIVDRKISTRLEMEPCLPLGIATWSTTGALKNIRLRRL